MCGMNRQVMIEAACTTVVVVVVVVDTLATMNLEGITDLHPRLILGEIQVEQVYIHVIRFILVDLMLKSGIYHQSHLSYYLGSCDTFAWDCPARVGTLALSVSLGVAVSHLKALSNPAMRDIIWIVTGFRGCCLKPLHYPSSSS